MMGLARCLRIRTSGVVRSRALNTALVLSLGLTSWILLAHSLTAQLTNRITSSDEPSTAVSAAAGQDSESPHHTRVRRFLRGRSVAARVASGKSVVAQDSSVPARSLAQAVTLARQQHAEMVVAQQVASPQQSPLSAAWESVGPSSVVTVAYGKVSGRVTAIAIDPADTTGNTVYVGTTGGGIWKSINAVGPLATVTFSPLTDTLPVFSADAGTVAIPSLSIGAISVQSGIVLAGTGDPNDAADSYYGSGILRSADGGQTWTLSQQSNDGIGVSHSFIGLGVAQFAWSSTVPGLVVVAISQAAEGSLVNATNASSVMGMYFSTDSGVTWQMATITDGSQVLQGALTTPTPQGGNAATAVVWNPMRKRFYGAIRFRGYFESADGVNWTRLASQPGATLSGAACLSGVPTCPLFRGALAVQPATGDTFALAVDRNNLDQGLWQDACGASSNACSHAVSFGTRLGGTALESGIGNSTIFQGDYNLTLGAVPATIGGIADTLLYVGTVDLYRCSLASGCVLRNTTNATNGCAAPAQVAPAQHAIALRSNTGTPTLFLGNDGGLWRSLDGVNEQAAVCSADDATHFDNLNGGIGSLAEVVSFAQHPTDASQLLVGLGANGSAGTRSDGSEIWGQLGAGEGGVVSIDPTNPALWYISTAAGVSIKACANGSSCTAADFAGAATVGSSQVSHDASLVDAPWLLDPLQPAELVVGTCRIWRGPAASGAQWSSTNAISRMLGGTATTACGLANPVIRSLAAGGAISSATNAQNAGSQTLYAGMAGAQDGGGNLGGHVFTTSAGATANSATTWTDITASPVTNDGSSGGGFNAGGFDISSIAVDSHDTTGKTVYVTVMGFAGGLLRASHLYGSTDGGVHWLNLSSNLPNSPANSVVVDPNDANTLYIALDTGIYVTTQVANCAAANCWSIYGTGLPNSPVMQLQVAAGMPTGDGRSGDLRAGTYGRGIWQIPLLTALSTSLPIMSVDSTSLSFSAQAVGTVSTAQTVTVTNSGNANLTASQISIIGDFHSTDTCVGSSIIPGGSCQLSITFLPSAIGTRTGILTIHGNVAGGQATVSLTGNAVAGASVVLDPVTLSFALTTINATSVAQNVTISNTGGVVATLGAISVSGDFILSANTCGSSLAAGVGCTAAITFHPTASGARSGALTVGTSGGNLTTLLSGTGTSPATDALSPLSLTFASQQLNTTSQAQQVTVTNAGDVALTLIAAQVTVGDFTTVNGCGNSLNAHSSCAISVAFIPKSIGAQNGTLMVTDQFRTQAVALNGTGIAPPGVSLSPFLSMVFGSTGVGLSSATQTATLTNNGGLPLTLSSVATTGDFAIVTGSNTCNGVIPVGGTCLMQIRFVPTAGGPRSGALSVTDNAVTSPQSLTLVGAGVDFTLTSNGSSGLTIATGQNAVFPLLLSSAANVVGTVAISCSGTPVNSTCTVSPGSVTLGSVTTVSVTVNTGVTVVTTRETRAGRFMMLLAWLLPIGIALQRRSLRRLMLLCLLVGCGSGRHIPTGASGPGSTSPITVSGTYPIVISASSVGLVRTVSLTLIVQ